MTSREMVQDSATRNQRSSVCASVALMLIVIKSGTIARDVFGG